MLENVRQIRLRAGLNQQQFWGKIGVTQSGGSRYESGRKMPRPVQTLVRVVHVDKIDLSAINHTDAQVLAYLKKQDRQLYSKLATFARQGAPKRRR